MAMILSLVAVLFCASAVLGKECGTSNIRTRPFTVRDRGTGKIIGGGNTTAEKWPWQISLYYRGEFSCGGSLLNNQWVITAAHCIMPNMGANELTVKLGKSLLNGREATEHVSGAANILTHGYYENVEKGYDIALIKLSNPVTNLDARTHINTVCLPDAYTNFIDSGLECYITGWGVSGYTQTTDRIQPKQLQEMRTRVTQCKSPWPFKICSVSSGKTACHGDSGGPLVCNVNGKFQLVGLVSYGETSPPICKYCNGGQVCCMVTCNTSGENIFTHISPYLQWISDVMKTY